MLTAVRPPRPAARLLAACAALAFAGALPAACADAPTAAAATAAAAALRFSANVAAAPEVATMVLTVSAADIATPVVANLAIANGVASGTLRVTPGAARTVTAQAFDQTGALAYEGSTTVEVRPGQNPPVALTLVGASGRLPITATLGSVTLAVTKAGGDTLFLGERRQFTAAITDAAGRAVAGQVAWASSNPARATVDSTGLVTTLAAGPVDIVATFAGLAARASVAVDGRPAADLVLFEAHEPNKYPYLGRMAIDGTGFTQIRPKYATGAEMAVFTPAWSPDRRRVVFTSHAPNGLGSDVWVTNADGSNTRRIVDLEGVEWHPRWSPDGTRVVFEHEASGQGWQLYVVNADGTGLTRLTSGAANRQHAAWSPDGARIAYTQYERGGVSQVYVMNADGTGQRPVRADGASSASPAWSPDGRRLTFASATGFGAAGLFIMDADGTNTHRLTDSGAAFDHAPAWSPDGQWLAFTSNRPGTGGLYRIRPDGTGLAAVPLPAGLSATKAAWR
jgi:hypothetical protein